MTINQTVSADTLALSLEGRLDTMTAPELEKAIRESIGDKAKIAIDMAKIEYVSSAGLRVLLSAQKLVNARGGSMVLSHVSDDVMEVFEITGFVDILTIE